MVQPAFMNRFAQTINFAITGTIPTAPLTERLTVNENQHVTLPKQVSSVRVLSGSAWISYLGKDIILKSGETLEIESSRDIAILTSLNHKPVELEISQ